jgi:nucleotide-binding universal stress UspA family protein
MPPRSSGARESPSKSAGGWGEILAELQAGEYDLLAIGAHRVASALDRLLLEDISGDLLDLSPLSTLVVKGETAG